MNKFTSIKNYTCYTTEEIEKLLSSATNSYEYDYIIDKLYLMQDNQRNTKNKFTYSFLTANQYKRKRKIEFSNSLLNEIMI